MDNKRIISQKAFMKVVLEEFKNNKYPAFVGILRSELNRRDVAIQDIKDLFIMFEELQSIHECV